MNTANSVNPDSDNILLDPMKRAAMLHRLARPHLTRSGSNGGKGGVPFSSGCTSTTGGSFSFPLLQECPHVHLATFDSTHLLVYYSHYIVKRKALATGAL